MPKERCSFCNVKKTPEFRMIGDVKNDDGDLICINCIILAKKTLDIEEKLGNNRKIVRPRCFKVV